jgi:hypothetical protein
MVAFNILKSHGKNQKDGSAIAAAGNQKRM